MPAVAERPIHITISPDRVRAFLQRKDINPASLKPESILVRLKELAILTNDAVAERVRQVVQAAQARTLPNEPILLAQGREPVPGSGAAFEYSKDKLASDQPAKADKDDHVDYHRSRIIMAQPGEVIGVLHPEVPPADGVDVHGKPIRGEKPRHSIRLGPNVRLAEDGQTVMATAAGKVHLTRHEVSVVGCLEFPADVDYSTGDIDSPTDVVVKGTVRKTFSVKSARSITVRRAIEACNVEAGTDLQVNGGIASHPQNRIIAGGEIFSKFCNNANLRAGADITITKEAMNCEIYTSGRLVIQHGALIGGTAYAREGAEVAELGNEAEAKTTIMIGVDPAVLAGARRIDEAIKKKEAAGKIRQKVQPLPAQLKRPTAQQRERATEPMYEADQMEAGITKDEKHRHEIVAAKSPAHEAALVVHKTLYPGVTIIFGDRMTLVQKLRRGPFKIVRRLVTRVEEIVLVDKLSGSLTTLLSREYMPGPEPAPATAGRSAPGASQLRDSPDAACGPRKA